MRFYMEQSGDWARVSTSTEVELNSLFAHEMKRLELLGITSLGISGYIHAPNGYNYKVTNADECVCYDLSKLH